MKIKISDLRDGEYLYNFLVDSKELDTGEMVFKDLISVDVRLTKAHGSLLTKIKVGGTMQLICDRCLDKFEYKFSTDFELLYKVSNSEYSGGNTEEDMNVIDIKPDEHEIDITEPVRDYVMLSVPMKKVPNEKEGKCILCGKVIDDMFRSTKSKDVNPVWEKLLRNKNKN